MSFIESLKFEIEIAKARLEQIEIERKELKKKLKTFNLFLAEYEFAEKELADMEANND